MNPHTPPEERDNVVLRLYEQVLEIEQRLIPTGMHIFGQAPDQRSAVEMLRMVVSFDRPEAGVRALPDLVAEGLSLPGYRMLLKESAASAQAMEARERVESIVREAVERFLSERSVAAAAEWLAAKAAVPVEKSSPAFTLLDRICGRLAANGEVDALVRALRGEYIEPGPGADVIQNPDILPTGRNTHAVNPYRIPSDSAFWRSEALAAELLDRFRSEKGRHPETIGIVLWGMDNIKTQGEGVAQVLWLLGAAPLRDSMNRVSDVEILPLERLGRPRIDVVLTVSGIFRDLFGPTMELIDKAVRAVAALDEPEAMNFVRKHVREAADSGIPPADAGIRLFSNAPGNYGTNVNFMVSGGQWEQPDEIGNLFIKRKCFAYGREMEGGEARELMERALTRVELTFQNIDSVEVGITDVDHYFEYLGGLSQAVTGRTGERPKVFLADSLSPQSKIRSIEETVRLEARTKTLNPKWYEGMLKHGYSGVAAIEHHVTNTFGWSATAQAVDGWVYEEIAGTFVFDGAMLDRLRTLNPHAARDIVGRLLEANGRGLWETDEQTVDRLRQTFGEIEDHLEGIVGTART